MVKGKKMTHAKIPKPRQIEPTRVTRRERLIGALLTSRSVAAAARAADVSLRTAMRWRTDPDFQVAYNQERARLLELVGNRLVEHGADYEQVLHNVAMNEQASPASRSAAAARGLEALSRFFDNNREQRLLEVEKAIVALKARRLRKGDL